MPRFFTRTWLLTTTAIVAVVLHVPGTTQAANLTLTASDSWADGGGTDAGPAAAGDNIDVNGFTLTVNNNGANNDGSGVNTFVIGDITDSGAGNVLITTAGSGADLTVTINSADVGGNTTLNDSANNVTVTFEGDVSAGGASGLVLGTGGANTATAVFDTSTIGDMIVSGKVVGNAGSTSNVTITGTADTVTTDAAWTALDTVTVGAGMTLDVGAALTATNINLGAAAELTNSGTGTINADITGTTGAEVINVTGTGTVGTAGNAIDMGSGNDTIAFTGSGTIDADTLDGGTGTDAVTVNGGDAVINADVTNIETFTVSSANTLTLTGDVTGGTITLGVTGSELIVNAAGKTVTSTISGTSGSGQAQTVTLTAGTVSGNINLGDGNDTINLDGATFTGDIDAGSGTGDAINLTTSFTTVGTIANAELIDVGGGANTFTVESAITGGGSTYGTAGIDVNSGVLEFNDGGSFAGSIFDNGGGGTVDFGADTLGGTFDIGGEIDDVAMTITSGTVTTSGFSLGSNTELASLTNAGTFVISAGDTVTATTQVAAAGTFTFGVASTANVGSLVLTGGALDLTGATIEVDASAATLSDGDIMLVADGVGAIVAGPGNTLTAVADNSFLWSFEMVDGTLAGIGGDNSELYLVATQAAATPNETNVGLILESLSASADADIIAVLAALDAAAPADVTGLLQQTMPNVTGTTTVMQNVSGGAMNIVDDVMADARTGSFGVPTGNAGLGNRTWVQAFGQQADQDVRDGIPGYEADTYGAALGWDTSNAGFGTLIGAGLSYARTKVDSDSGNNAQTDIDSYQAMIYASMGIYRTFINLQGTYAYNVVDTVRTNIGGNTFGSYKTSQYGGRAQLGRDFGYSDGPHLTTSLVGNWMHVDPQSYTETGFAPLNVRGRTLDLADAGLMIDAGWKNVSPDGSSIEPKMHLGYRYDLTGERAQTTSSFTAGGGTFVTSAMQPARHIFDVGAGLTVIGSGGADFRLEYDYEFKEDYKAHSGLARAGLRY